LKSGIIWNIITITLRVIIKWGFENVEILYQGRKIEKVCREQSYRIKKHGAARSLSLEARLDELEDIANLEQIRLFPQARCHELKGDRKGTLAVYLDGPWRLIFEPANAPVPKKPDGGLDWTRVTAIRILEVRDYHG
jgi:plasmid maintenance system killer protein